MTTFATKQLIDIEENILNHDNYVNRNGEVIQINKINKLDERYKTLYYTFNGNPKVGVLNGDTYRDVFLILKSGNYYMLTYKYNNFYEVLFEKENDTYHEEEEEKEFFGNNFNGHILYKNV